MDRGSERPAAHTQQKLTHLSPPPPPLQAHYPDLGRDTSSVWNALVSQTSFRRENTGGVVKCQLFFQAL